MTRDFSKDLTIMVAGSGNSTMQHLEEILADWIFGPVDEREVHVIVPVLTNMGGALRNLIKLGTEWEFKFTVIQAKDAAMTRELSALPEECFIRADNEREALQQGLDILAQHHNGGNETAFLLAYNPKSTYERGNPTLSDFEIIGDAKNYTWLSTLNLCEGLIDAFEGYETTDEIIKRKHLQQEFEDEQRKLEAAAPTPAKKVSAPRKRAAKKAVAEESKPLLVEPEKPLVERLDALVEKSVQQHKKTELSATAPLVRGECKHFYVWADDDNGHSGEVCKRCGAERPEDVASGPSMDVWSEVAAAQPQKTHTILVSKADLTQLSIDIGNLTEAFGNIMSTFTRILKDG